MRSGILTALMAAAALGAGTARGEAFFVTGGQHITAYSFYQGYETPTLLHQTGGDNLPQRGYAAIADFNGDGFPDVAQSDVLTLAPFAGTIRVLDGKTWATITTVWLNLNVSTNGNGAPIAAGDVNGDGFPDLIAGPNTGAGGSSQIRVFSGSNWTQLPSTFTPNGSRVASADFNHDGKSDIITSGTVYNAVNGNVLFTFAPGNGQFAAGDVNGDNTPDIAVEDALGISVYSGIDQQLIKSVPLTGTYSLALADMNLDGFADFVTYNDTNGVKILSGIDASVLNTSTVFPPGPGLAGEIAAFAAVPEPGTLCAFAFGALGMFLRRRAR